MSVIGQTTHGPMFLTFWKRLNSNILDGYRWIYTPRRARFQSATRLYHTRLKNLAVMSLNLYSKRLRASEAQRHSLGCTIWAACLPGTFGLEFCIDLPLTQLCWTVVGAVSKKNWEGHAKRTITNTATDKIGTLKLKWDNPIMDIDIRHW